jgi:ribonucleoside-diphosphate reductase alpha chain
MGSFAHRIMQQKYSQIKIDGSMETWPEIAYRVAKNVLGAVNAEQSQIEATARLIAQRKFIPGGRYLYASGRPFHQVQNCLLMRAEDSREGWADHLHKCAMALMTGAGIGIDYSLVRPRGSIIKRTGGFATGPIALMQMTNECGRGIMQGGSRRSAIWAGLNWAHPDIMEFIHLKDWSPEVRAAKEKDFNYPATMDGTNISVQLDDDFFDAYHNRTCGNYEDPGDVDVQQRDDPDDEGRMFTAFRPKTVKANDGKCLKCAKSENAHKHQLAQDVYWKTVRHMLESAEPGFSVDVGVNAGESLRNACTEVTSSDDSDICNLGSINMAQIDSKEEMQAVVELGTYFLLAGTVYSDVPYEKVDEIRTKNRRLGLGVMGLHEWMLKRGYKYGPSAELHAYMSVYAQSTEMAGKKADEWGLSRPVKTRAVAPTGTIGIVAETTTGLEPIFCVAYKRRALQGQTWTYQYVIDPAAKRLIDNGVDPDLIEDAYDLAKQPERRVAFQAWLQQYVDHSISSTLNLPAWGSEYNNEERVKPFGDMLITYLPKLRGMTCYPDGARGGQPLTPVSLKTALKHVDQVFYETTDVCDLTKGGSCGS